MLVGGLGPSWLETLAWQSQSQSRYPERARQGTGRARKHTRVPESPTQPSPICEHSLQGPAAWHGREPRQGSSQKTIATLRTIFTGSSVSGGAWVGGAA